MRVGFYWPSVSPDDLEEMSALDRECFLAAADEWIERLNEDSSGPHRPGKE